MDGYDFLDVTCLISFSKIILDLLPANQIDCRQNFISLKSGSEFSKLAISGVGHLKMTRDNKGRKNHSKNQNI